MIAKKALELLNDVEFSEKYQGVQEYTEMLIVCKEALDKQIPRKPIDKIDPMFGDICIVCSNCENTDMVNPFTIIVYSSIARIADKLWIGVIPNENRIYCQTQP